jgi:hypothetical protein
MKTGFLVKNRSTAKPNKSFCKLVNVATFENVLDRWYCFLDSVYVSPDENQD